MSSEGLPKELMVDDLSRRPSILGGARTDDDIADCTELLELLRIKGAPPCAAKTTEDFARAACVGESEGDGRRCGFETSVCLRLRADKGDLCALGDSTLDLVDTALVEALGVSGVDAGTFD